MKCKKRVCIVLVVGITVSVACGILISKKSRFLPNEIFSVEESVKVQETINEVQLEKLITISEEGELSDPVIRKLEGSIDASTIENKVICGYQGWFAALGDDGINSWMHWGKNIVKKNMVSIEMYPDIREYPKEKLYNTFLEPFIEGEKRAKLYSAYDEEAVDIHFRWMQEYGIDGVALQRFATEAIGPNIVHFNKVLQNVKESSEKYKRIFYLTYDISGFKGDDAVEKMIVDFEEVIEGTYNLIESPCYANMEGKPVIQIWGLGVDGSCKLTPEQSLKMIEYFKGRGMYVIVGTPTYWRTSNIDSISGFEEVYKSCDMISPWTIGRIRNEKDAKKYYNQIARLDKELCNQRGQDYMPVMFAGFAWSNWNNGVRNEIPRNRGEFLWEQARLCKELSPKSVYMAMYDEYDEGTAIMKIAEDSSMIPSDQYFLTTSADGTYLSSDFYLRLVGYITSMIGGEKAVSDVMPISYSEGPVYFRSSFESYTDSIPRFKKTNNINTNFNSELKLTTGAESYKGRNALYIKGNGTAKDAYASYYFMDGQAIEILPKMRMSYYVKAKDLGGSRIIVDILTTDGTRLSEIIEANQYVAGNPSISKHPLDEWTKVIMELGDLMLGKTIESLMITYKGEEETVECYIDDLTIYTYK